jgi:uncharacterized protein
MKIENSFIIDAPITDAWDMVTDIPVIAQCLPGAVLRSEDAGVHTGSVTFKVGPVTAEYQGSAELIEQDEINRRVVIDSKASDLRGTGDGQAVITAELTDHGSHTKVNICTELQVAGKVAQFSRGVMQDASERLFGQFAACLAAKLEDTAMLEAIAMESAAAQPPDIDDGEALDLLHVAGRAIAKRVVPMALVALIIVAVLLFLI